MLAVVPLAGLLLAGCGGSGSDGSGGEEPLGLQTTGTSGTSGDATAAPTASADSTERFDITVLTICDAVQSALDETPAKAKPAQMKAALRKELNAAFKASTTPKATIAEVKVDKLLNQGCPGERAKALQRAQMYDFTPTSFKATD